VGLDDIGTSAYLVSFTMKDLKKGIGARAISTYEDRSTDESSSLATGGGIYFQNREVAQRVVYNLMRGIDWCQKKESKH